MNKTETSTTPLAVRSNVGLGVTEDDLDNLRHMLGARKEQPKRSHGYRNYFAAGASQMADMERLVDAGFAVRGAESYQLKYYHATVDGCKAIGLSKAAIKRAFEP